MTWTIRYRGDDVPLPLLDPLPVLAPPEVPLPVAPVPLLPGAFCSGALPGVEYGDVEEDPGVVLDGVAWSLVVPSGVAEPLVPGAIVPELLDPG